MNLTATYSPEDNKLKLYSLTRLPEEDYKRLRAAGFSWAPKQELFVAPMWTPSREDLLLELCGEIGDEDTSLVDRAEQRAERFEQYSESRADDAKRAREQVAAIADNIPFGQPILVGHHSERHARRDAERIESGMRKAVKMWETSSYWEQRAKGALLHAKYKERPSVRARRIKGLEADLRKQKRTVADLEASLASWEKVAALPEAEQHAAALALAGTSEAGWLRLPRKEGDRPDWDQRPTAYDGLSNHYPNLYAPRTVSEVIEAARKAYPRDIAYCGRWIAHYENRLTYERAMLAADGGIEADKNKPEVGGGCKCWASPRGGGWSFIQKVNKVSVTVLDNWGNGGGNFTSTMPFDKLAAVMSKADVDKARADGRLTESSDKTGFYLSDEAPKASCKPEPKSPEDASFEAMKSTLRAGVQVVSAPQLFPTPPELAGRLVELADIQDGHSVLEPSAGTGRIIDAIRLSMAGGTSGRCVITAVEINPQLAKRLCDLDCLGSEYVHCADFLQQNGNLGKFDRILMNPPFERGSDIQHILHARSFLKPGGRLVAICANGPRQQESLKLIASKWIELEDGTFSEEGTNVRTALLVLTNNP